ncbi:hypothetical protein K7X08_007172 [Anisodus acutangulus]|uniref:BTB/POZ domain-containing protein n=1 Tax=Anisodus acutangulus TaxID=402998 RepID=A0A9Q1LFA6_9SOLA|nr:hypothetical protein K7X08_007172 [Anisodus acutangulus]
MAFVKLGSKSEAFRREGQAWHCTSDLPSDVTIEIGEMSFYLHKFPLISRSGLQAKLIKESCNDDGSVCVLQLSDVPGGAKTFELVAKFCYGVKIELTPLNVVSLRCASEYLQMTDEYGDGNLISQTEAFLNDVFGNWTDTIKALETCEEVLPHAEELHIVSRCINSLAMKACTDTKLFNWPVSENGHEGPTGADVWNGICTGSKTQPVTDDWWYEDVSFLSLPLYKRLIQAVEAGGMRPENVAGALVFYTKKYIPLMNRQESFKDATNHSNSGSTISTPSKADQRALLEEIMELLPNQRGVTETRLMNCQKLSLEACTHAAQNERLPLRVIVQVLFFEQLRLRTSISGWFFVSDNLDGSQSTIPHGGNYDANRANGRGSSIDDMRERVAELEKECNSMRQEFKKVVKTKKKWNVFCGRKSECDLNSVKPLKLQPPPVNEHKNHKNGDSS